MIPMLGQILEAAGSLESVPPPYELHLTPDHPRQRTLIAFPILTFRSQHDLDLEPPPYSASRPAMASATDDEGLAALNISRHGHGGFLFHLRQAATLTGGAGTDEDVPGPAACSAIRGVAVPAEGAP